MVFFFLGFCFFLFTRRNVKDTLISYLISPSPLAEFRRSRHSTKSYNKQLINIINVSYMNISICLNNIIIDIQDRFINKIMWLIFNKMTFVQLHKKDWYLLSSARAMLPPFNQPRGRWECTNRTAKTMSRDCMFIHFDLSLRLHNEDFEYFRTTISWSAVFTVQSLISTNTLFFRFKSQKSVSHENAITKQHTDVNFSCEA